MIVHPLRKVPEQFHSGQHLGITSVCSAHPVVIEAALELARDTGNVALIEATCNQVNQDGGYTGMTPASFRQYVQGIAKKVGLDFGKVVLGGDHLGPNPWKNLPADEAMEKAEAMIAAYASAGFTKLHLDTSMGCRGEPVALADEATAERAARLAAVAERHKGAMEPVYVIGTEVPVPGGATHALDTLEVTAASAVGKTHDVHRDAFQKRGLADAFSRVIALVVQPGVEFGDDDVIHYDRTKARQLSATLHDYPGLVFEAHSTDYQTAAGLRDLVGDGFAILKVGPWLTFALREALYALDGLADILEGSAPRGRLMETMERLMLASPDNWKKYYAGNDGELWLKRHFSYSDRIRYYWPSKEACEAVEELVSRIGKHSVPEPVIHQFFPNHSTEVNGTSAERLLVGAVREVLKIYDDAVRRDP